MFKQVKSALFWYYIYKFRKRVAIVFTLLILILLSEYIYSDIVEYLKLRNRLDLLDIILPAKWTIIILSIFYIFYSIFSFFRYEEKGNKEPEEKKPKKLGKKDIRRLAQDIIESKKNV